MTGWEIFLLIVLIYFVMMFVLSQIFIPNLGWKREIDEELPSEAKKDLKRIGDSYKKKEDVLKAVVDYMLVEKGFYGAYRQVFNQFSFLFESSITKLWNKGGFLHCHQHNFMLRYLLLGTKRFIDDDIDFIITNCVLNIHQYVRVNVSDSDDKKKWISIDTFSISLGYKYGTTLPRFNIFRKKKRKSKQNIKSKN